MWPCQDVPVLELEPPIFGWVKIEPELLELPDPLLLELLEPALLLLELLLEFAPDDPLDDEPSLVTALAVVAAVCVNPHIPAKTPIVAAAMPARSPRRAASRDAEGRRAPLAETVWGAAT
jgi:hypothetical protein